MAFSDRIASLQSNAERQLHALSSAKKTENALVLPFFETLGYDPFNVREVEPDFEIGHQQGTKRADYAIKKGGDPIMLFQCAEAKTDLGIFDDHFLPGSLDAVGASVAAFTNGLNYRFYADLQFGTEIPSDPFLEFNLLEYGAEQVEALKRLTRPAFDSEQIRSAAFELQSSQLLRGYLAGQTEAPDDHFVRFLAAQVYEEQGYEKQVSEGDESAELLDRFRPVVQKVLRGLAEKGDDSQSVPAGSPDQSSPDQSSPDQSLSAKREGAKREETSRKKDSAPPTSEQDIELATSTNEPSTNEPSNNEPSGDGETIEANGGDPFEKNLAKQVIEEF